MALLHGRAGDVAGRFLALEANREDLSGLQPVECESGMDECHGTSLLRDVDFEVWRGREVVLRCCRLD